MISVEPDLITADNNPHGVALDAGHVYWTNPFLDAIGRATLDTSGSVISVEQGFITGASFPAGVAIGT